MCRVVSESCLRKFALSSLGPRILDNVKTFLLIELEDAFIVTLSHFENSSAN